MKRKVCIACGIIAVSVAATCGMWIQRSSDEFDSLVEMNVEALSRSESGGISACFGIWGTCTLPDGTKSKAPAVYYDM